MKGAKSPNKVVNHRSLRSLDGLTDAGYHNLCNKINTGAHLKLYIKSFLAWSFFPLLIGAVIGWLYQYASTSAQEEMRGGIIGFNNQYIFELFVFVNLMLVCGYVFIKGQVEAPFNKTEKFIFYILPGAALGFVVPFFGALYGFIIGHPSHPDLANIAILGGIAIVWSVGFYLLLLAPAYSGVYPKDVSSKKKLYYVV